MSFKGLILIGVACICVFWTLVYQYRIAEFGGFKGVVQSDGKGYYAYLPAVFVERDLSWNFYFEQGHEEMLQHFDKRFLMDQNGHKLLKTYCGEAILLSPFFMAGTVIGNLRGQPVTGYEPWMQGLIHVAALFYLLLGIWFWMKFLALFGVGKRAVLLSVLALVFATNLFHYATVEVTMTHVYSFSMMACFLYASKQLLETHARKYWIISAVVLALIALIRPVNIVVVIILPFLADSSTWWRLLQKPRIIMLAAFVLFVAMCSVQPVLNYLQCGMLFPWSYGEEGFFWSKPAIVEVLFSFRKGLFIYCPIFFLISILLIVAFKNQKRLVVGILLLGMVVTYIISSWWSWYYGPGFGHRAFIDWYPVLLLPLAVAVGHLNPLKQKIVYVLTCALIVLTSIQTYQYQSGIFEKEDMSMGGYAHVFLKTSAAYRNVLAGEHELHFLPLDTNLADTMMNFSADTSAYTPDWCTKSDVFVFEKNNPYGPVFKIQETGDAFNQRTWFTASIKVQTPGGDPCRNASVVLVVEDTLQNSLIYKAMRFRDFPEPTKTTGEFTVEQLIEPISDPHARISVYVYNPDGAEFALDEFSCAFQSFKRDLP